MPTPAREARISRLQRAVAGGHARGLAPLVLGLLLAAGCGHSERHAKPGQGKPGAEGSTAGISVVHPVRRDIRMRVVQPGTIQAFEETPIYSRIAGYVGKYRYNIGDRVKARDVLLDMWIPDLEEEVGQRSAAVMRAEVQIRVAESALKSAEARLETAKARVLSAEAGVRRAQASYTRWESEYKRLTTLVNQRVLDVQVRDETYRQFEEAAAARDQATAAVAEASSARDMASADVERARVDIEAARADLDVAHAAERLSKVEVEYGHIKAPYDSVITQRNVSPGDYLQPGGGPNGRPLFVVEQTDPVRVFVGVPELASFFIHDQDTALIRFQAIPGATREGKVVRSGFSLNPSTRTLQTEIDIPNSDDHLRPGWYVTVTIEVVRKQVWALPSNAIAFQGQQNYVVYLLVNGKPVRTPVIIGPSDDTYTEVLKKHSPNANTNDWPDFDGTEQVLAGNLDLVADSQPVSGSGPGTSPGSGSGSTPTKDASR
jgi:HlyD family secretion protein